MKTEGSVAVTAVTTLTLKAGTTITLQAVNVDVMVIGVMNISLTVSNK